MSMEVYNFSSTRSTSFMSTLSLFCSARQTAVYGRSLETMKWGVEGGPDSQLAAARLRQADAGLMEKPVSMQTLH